MYGLERNTLVKSIDNISFFDFIKSPFFFNQLVLSSSNRYLPVFLDKVVESESVLDVGCGLQSIIPEKYNVMRCDYNFNNLLTYVANALYLPVKDESYNHIVNSWVFEHLEESEKALKEFNRVIKKNGLLYLTANMAWHIHEQPRDYYRFTEYGLKYLIEKADFQIEFFAPTLRFWGTTLQIINYRVVAIFSGLHIKALHPIITVPLQIIAYFFEKYDRNSSICAGYCIIARKIG